MNPLDWYDFLREIPSDSGRLASFFAGGVITLLTAFVVFLVYRDVLGRRKLEPYVRKIRDLSRENVELSDKHAQLTFAKAAQDAELRTTKTDLALAQDEVKRLSRQAHEPPADRETTRGIVAQDDAKRVSPQAQEPPADQETTRDMVAQENRTQPRASVPAGDARGAQKERSRLALQFDDLVNALEEEFKRKIGERKESVARVPLRPDAVTKPGSAA